MLGEGAGEMAAPIAAVSPQTVDFNRDQNPISCDTAKDQLPI
jgi:hypothetical protein